jgi:hypothetical protein
MRKLLRLVLTTVLVVLVPSTAFAHHEGVDGLQLDYVGRCSILDDEEGHARLGGTVRLYYEEQSQQPVYSGVEVKWLIYRRFPATEDWELVRTTTQRTTPTYTGAWWGFRYRTDPPISWDEDEWRLSAVARWMRIGEHDIRHFIKRVAYFDARVLQGCSTYESPRT